MEEIWKKYLPKTGRQRSEPSKAERVLAKTAGEVRGDEGVARCQWRPEESSFSLNKLLVLLEDFDTPFIPNKLQLGRRLAQCLNPSLPNGVHQNTLAVYRLVFKNLSLENLSWSEDLGIFSMGIFPFLKFCSVQVDSFHAGEIWRSRAHPGILPSFGKSVGSLSPCPNSFCVANARWKRWEGKEPVSLHRW